MTADPYKPPTTPPGKPRPPITRSTVLTVVLVVLTLPAAGIAFFVTCTGIVLSSNMRAPDTVVFGGSGAAAVVTIAAIGYVIYRLNRR